MGERLTQARALIPPSQRTCYYEGQARTTTGGETMARKLIIALFFVAAAALLGETQSSNAQSAYSYPWCAIYFSGGNFGGGSRSCYYTSWEQCMTTMSGIGGNCVQSPYYREQPTPLPHRANMKPHNRRHV
jgi:hypothetical protein